MKKPDLKAIGAALKAAADNDVAQAAFKTEIGASKEFRFQIFKPYAQVVHNAFEPKANWNQRHMVLTMLLFIEKGLGIKLTPEQKSELIPALFIASNSSQYNQGTHSVSDEPTDGLVATYMSTLEM